MIKIAFIIDTLDSPAAGGTERQVLMLLDGLDRKKFVPFLIVLHNSSWLSQQKFPFEFICMDLSRRHTPVMPAILSIWRFCGRNRIDIVQTFFREANIVGTIGAKLAYDPIVISSRRNMGYWQSSFDRILLKPLRWFTDFYIANSQAAASHAMKTEGIKEGKMHVIYNGLSLEQFKGQNQNERLHWREIWHIPPAAPVIGCVANLTKVKGIPSIIQSAFLLKKDFPELHFVVVGDGPDRPQLEAMIAKNRLTDRFHLAGSVTDPVSCLSAFDIALLASQSEGFSNSLVEYMAAKLPIIVSDGGGNCEAIGHEAEGLIFSVGKAQELSSSIRRLLTDAALASRLAENARSKAIRLYDRRTFIANHENFYEHVLSRKRPRATSS